MRMVWPLRAVMTVPQSSADRSPVSRTARYSFMAPEEAPATRRYRRYRVFPHDSCRYPYHWARVAAQRDPASRAKYQALRARGHGHGHARTLRSVADRLLNVACAMLRNRACFDPHRAETAAA